MLVFLDDKWQLIDEVAARFLGCFVEALGFAEPIAEVHDVGRQVFRGDSAVLADCFKPNARSEQLLLYRVNPFYPFLATHLARRRGDDEIFIILSII